jgi:hypothetical protein
MEATRFRMTHVGARSGAPGQRSDQHISTNEVPRNLHPLGQRCAYGDACLASSAFPRFESYEAAFRFHETASIAMAEMDDTKRHQRCRHDPTGSTRTSSISSMSFGSVDRSAPALCPNMSASFSTATGAIRASKHSPIQVESMRWARRSSTRCLFGATMNPGVLGKRSNLGLRLRPPLRLRRPPGPTG